MKYFDHNFKNGILKIAHFINEKKYITKMGFINQNRESTTSKHRYFS